MPCLIITGHPSAGKTELAHKLKERALLHPSIDEVIIVNEESACPDHTKSQCYETAFSEKQTRGALKSAFDRSNKTPRTLVILDSLNYIKGFRYELHCISKAVGERHGVLWVLNRLPIVEEWNSKRPEKEAYPPQLLKELIQRYEPPDERNRWDKPLYTIDVAPPDTVDDAAGSTKDSKSEALSQSVYNMHALGEAMGGGKSSTTTCTGPTPPTTKPKKSAFSRAKAKPKPATEPKEQESTLFNEAQNEKLQPSQAAATTTGNSKLEVTKTGKKSLEESLDAILNTFLLSVQPLKAGASTQQHIPTNANVLQEIDSITQKLVSAISHAQNFHTGGKLQVKAPYNNVNNGGETTLLMEYKRTVALPELRRLRKQFLQWVATHPPTDSSQKGISEWFLRYIEDQLR